ncbi:hypothetical protein NTH_00894 [Nitratireductor thuwali]|uniref:Uncharacterized protein n=1 Tax=Nitratireductor thuwali TaxID=2267699 RepID=A0ABY5MF80_9HYPH|nr:hypothetical protein NTH_00894 [Nitratireductor thuwali]
MEAAARTAGHIGDEPGKRSMTRHAMIQPTTAGIQPPAADPRASIVISEPDRAAPFRAQVRQHRAAAQRSGLSVSIPVIPDGGRATADTG